MKEFENVAHTFITNSEDNFFVDNLKKIRNFDNGKKIWVVSSYSGSLNKIYTGIGENTFINSEEKNFFSIFNKSLQFLINYCRDILFFSNTREKLIDIEKYRELIIYLNNNEITLYNENNNFDFFIINRKLIKNYLQDNNLNNITEENLKELMVN
tara:strand:+ start:165 stop:629 length:465 start_codon:yes stop_codon:yes gene_type:complete